MIDFGKRGVIVLLLLLLGCTTSAEEPAAESSALSPRATEIVTASTAVPTSAPTAVPPTLTAIPTAAPPVEQATPTAEVEVEEVLPTATAEIVEVVEEEVVLFGRTEEGALFRGAADAPVTLIDYSDFLWPTCRSYVLGTEPTLVEEFVETGQLKIVFWPVINHGQPSVFSTATMACIGEQDIAAAFEAHDQMFDDQRSLYSADRDYYMRQAEAVGVDMELFADCYDSGRGVEQALALDEIRLERGIYGQPTFDLNGMIALGAIPVDSFRDAIEQQLAE